MSARVRASYSRHLPLLLIALVVGLLPTISAAPAAAEVGTVFDFEDFYQGSVHEQWGWLSPESLLPSQVDHGIVGQSTYPSMGAQVLRVSDAGTLQSPESGTHSTALSQEAGESAALDAGEPSGQRQPFFVAAFDIASVTQTNQNMNLIVNAGGVDGADFMSRLRIFDDGDAISVAVTYFNGTNQVETVIAEDLSYTAVHHIRWTIQFVDGPANDIVTVMVNDVARYNGASFEGALQNGSTQPRIVESLTFYSQQQTISNAGSGYYIDRVRYMSGPTPGSSSTKVVGGPGTSGVDDWSSLIIVEGGSSGVFGPATPPLGLGSHIAETGDDPGTVHFMHLDSANVPLSEISALSYASYNVVGDACETPVASLWINLDGGNEVDDILHFFPCRQSGPNLPSGVPVQPQPQNGVWQTWDAWNGLWSNSDGSVTTTIADYITANPDARLGSPQEINLFGISVGVGTVDAEFFNSEPTSFPTGWTETVSNIDAVTMTIYGATTTYDFEPWPDTDIPTVTNLAATPNPAVAPATVTVSATLSDVNDFDDNTTLKSAVYTTGSGAPRSLTPVDGAWDEATEEVRFTLTNLAARDHTICIRTTDVSGNVSANTCTTITVTAPPPVDTAAPTLSNLQTTPNPVRVGQNTVISGNIDDTATGNSTITSAQYRINSGSWQALLPADGRWDEASEAAQKALAFSTPGTYTVCLRAADRYGNQSAEQCTTVMVMNPASKVTGSGQFTSPRNGVTSRPTYSGRATVSIQASYPSQQATTPTGGFRLTLTGTAFTFQSTALTSLTTGSGGVGELRGTGTLNGAAGYSFSVTFDDNGTGTQDKLRVHIWNTTTNAVIYDSQPGAATTAAPTIRLTSGNLTVTP